MTGLRRFQAANPFLAVGIVGVAMFGAWLALGLDPRDGATEPPAAMIIFRR